MADVHTGDSIKFKGTLSRNDGTMLTELRNEISPAYCAGKHVARNSEKTAVLKKKRRYTIHMK